MRLHSILGAILSLSWAATAGASPSIALYFTHHNGSPIAEVANLQVAPGDQVGVAARMTTDQRGVKIYTFSIDFDSGGLGRIDLLDFVNTPPPELPIVLGVGTPWGPDEPDGAPGFIKFFVGASLEPDPDTRNKVFTVATASFLVTLDILDGSAVIAPGFFFPSFDNVWTADNQMIGADYALTGATLIPEPSSTTLLGASLIGLAALAALRRRSAGAAQASRRS